MEAIEEVTFQLRLDSEGNRGSWHRPGATAMGRFETISRHQPTQVMGTFWTFRDCGDGDGVKLRVTHSQVSKGQGPPRQGASGFDIVV